MHDALGSITGLHKLDVVVDDCNVSSTWEEAARGSEFQSHPQLDSEFETAWDT